MNLKQLWVLALILVMLSLGGYLYYEKQTEARPQPRRRYSANGRVATSTMLLFSVQNSPAPQDVTRSCLECHPQAASGFHEDGPLAVVGTGGKNPGKK